MKTCLLLTSACILLACAPAPRQDGDPARLRDDLVKARLEILDLKLQLARLGGRPDDELKALEEAVRSDIPEVGAAALRELAKLPEDRRRAAQAVVLARFPAAPEAVRVQAVAFLRSLPTPEAEAVVVRAAADASPSVRIAAASALKASASAAALQALLGLLRDAQAEVRSAALDALGVAKREQAVEPLLALVRTEPDPAVREKAVDALGAIGSAAAVDPLLALLETSDRPTLRWSCINSLGQIGDPRAAPRLRPQLDPKATPDVRQVAIEALGRLRDAASVPALAAILRDDKDERLRERAAAAIGLIAGDGAGEAPLLEAFVVDPSDMVRRAAWTALAGAAGERLDANERLATALLARGRRAEADALCTRLHAIKPDEASRPRALALEEKVAAAAFDAGDAKAALPHYRQMQALAPDRTDILRRIAACLRELKDADGRIKALRELEAKLLKGDGPWWDTRLEVLSILEAGRDAEAVVEEATALLALNAPPHPEDRRRTLESALQAATLRLVQPIAERDPSARQMALDAVRRVGRKILLVLAAEAETAKGALPTVVEAANLIAQTAVDPATSDAAKLREAAAAWRQWAARAEKP